MKVPVIASKTAKIICKKAPVILSGLSIAGFVSTVVFAVKASPKAELIVDRLKAEYEYKFKQGETDSSKVPTIVVAKNLAPVYLPTVVMGGFTIACIVSSTVISSRRNAVLTSLYSASEFALKEYQRKVVETIGEKKETSIRDDIAKDRLAENPLSRETVILTGAGDSLCYDAFSGRYFKSNIERIRRAENDINRRIISEMWVSLNELYFELGLEPIKLGNSIGWNVDFMLELEFSSQIADNGQPCLVMDCKVEPRKYV